MPEFNIERVRMTSYRFTLDPGGTAYNFGAHDGAKVSIKPLTKDIKIKSLGDVVLDKWIIGSEISVGISAREIDDALFRTLFPWSPATGSIPLSPDGVNTKYYQYAKKLNLHPIDLDNSDLTQDINLLKSVPMWENGDADGSTDNVEQIVFGTFPDHAQLPRKVYGYLGVAPA